MTPADMAATYAAAFTQSRPWSTQEFQTLLQSPHVFAAGDQRAFALVRVIADEAELLTIATDPAFQRQGLARQVMAGWQAEAARRGAVTAFLEVAADNTPAINLYESCGFESCGRRAAYYQRTQGQAADALLMQRDLR